MRAGIAGRRSSVDGKQLCACTRRAISLLQNKGILRDDNCSPSLPSYPYSRNTNARLRMTLQKFALGFFSLFIFTFRKAIFVRRSRYETREIALVLLQLRENSASGAGSIVSCLSERLLRAMSFSIRNAGIYLISVIFTHMTTHSIKITFSINVL